MNIPILDASNYFRGLLLLIRKDRKITQPEIDLMRRVGKVLGFEQRFCDNAIEEILENKFIVDEPPSFSSKGLAVSFVKDGLSLALADGEFHPNEEHWLRSAAEKNGLTADFFSQVLESVRQLKGIPLQLEVEQFLGRS